LDVFVTKTEVDALILENNLIRKHKPKYNINLKDSQRYAYLKVTDEKFARIITARDKKEKGSYFGPFTSAQNREDVRKLVTESFKIRTCKRLPKQACLRYHIGLCTAPCIGKISEAGYDRDLQKAKLILKGKNTELLGRLSKEMSEQSKNMEYEKALVLRNQIGAVKFLDEKQSSERDKKYDEDVINFIERDQKAYLLLFNIYKGILTNKKEFEFDSSPEILEEFITRYYSTNPVPKEIIVSKKVDSSIQDYLKKISKKRVRIVVPQKGEKSFC